MHAAVQADAMSHNVVLTGCCGLTCSKEQAKFDARDAGT
mgnify:CR=1 FL=1